MIHKFSFYRCLQFGFAWFLLVAVYGGVLEAQEQEAKGEDPANQLEPVNFGSGVRYNIFEAQNVWVGLDVARGPEAWNWYIQVGHPW